MGGDRIASLGLEARVEIWSRAVYAIQDFPFTGCGLGTFRRIVPILYPLFLISSDADIGHAHNLFLVGSGASCLSTTAIGPAKDFLQTQASQVAP